MTKIMALANQKGGVGKTTLAVQTAARGVECGLNTLLVDLDQQGSATMLSLGDAAAHRIDEGSALDLWYDDRELQIVESERLGFDVLRASHHLDAVDDDLPAGVTALSRLKDLGYDLIVIDTPPAPGVRQLAPLLVADMQLAPVTPDLLGTQGLANMLAIFQQLSPRNPGLVFRAVINLRKRAATSQDATIEQVRRSLGDRLMPQELIEREQVRQALQDGKTVWRYATSDKDAVAYRDAVDAALAAVGLNLSKENAA